eukprot:scaffold392796_cov44-Prasinocladus_malaysianus.AAC.1
MSSEAVTPGVEILLLAFDIDEPEGLTYEIRQPPARGSIEMVGQMELTNSTSSSNYTVPGLPYGVRYIPESYLHGEPLDSFLWTATDSTGEESEPFQVDIYVYCAPGHSVDPDSDFCSQCPSGTKTLPAALHQTECMPCSVGTFTASLGSTACSPCPKNTFQDSEGAAECKQCGPQGMVAPEGSLSSSD